MFTTPLWEAKSFTKQILTSISNGGTFFSRQKVGKQKVINKLCDFFEKIFAAPYRISELTRMFYLEIDPKKEQPQNSTTTTLTSTQQSTSTPPPKKNGGKLVIISKYFNYSILLSTAINKVLLYLRRNICKGTLMELALNSKIH